MIIINVTSFNDLFTPQEVEHPWFCKRSRINPPKSEYCRLKNVDT